MQLTHVLIALALWLPEKVFLQHLQTLLAKRPRLEREERLDLCAVLYRQVFLDEVKLLIHLSLA